MKSQFLPRAVAFLVFTILSVGGAHAQVLQMRAVVDAPNADTEMMTYQMGSETKVVFVERAVAFDYDANIKSVTVKLMGPVPNLIVQFSDKGSARFAEMGNKYDGRKLATIVNGRLATFGPIRAPLGGSATNIPCWCSKFTEEELKEIASRIAPK